MKRAAITGSNGRLAPGVSAFLKERGWSVRPFSRVASGATGELRSLAVPSVMEKFDVILHLGWSTVPLLSEENPGIEEREDFPFLQALMDAASACEVPPLIVFASSAAVYGNTGYTPVDEESPCRPLGRYARAKLEAEGILAAAPRVCSLRITNVFGAQGRAARPQGIIPRLIEACRYGTEVTIWGDGSALKDYVFVGDLQEAMIRVMESQLTGVFNVASGHVLSVNELISVVESSVGMPLLRVQAPHFDWDVECARVSSEALERRTGWSARVDPVRAIHQMAVSEEARP